MNFKNTIKESCEGNCACGKHAKLSVNGIPCCDDVSCAIAIMKGSKVEAGLAKSA